MASRKNDTDGKAEGFQIPIEDAADEAVKEESSEVGSAESTSDAPEEAEAEAEVIEDEPDIVAEAEAVVEEAAAADELEKARKEASEWQDRYLRLHAEWDTYRRRTAEQRAEERAHATEKLVEDILPVLDDFERSVAYAAENGEAGLIDGVKAIQTKLVDVLVRTGVEIIDPAGGPFDALEAQAVGTVPDEEAYDETVHDVYQKGYKMGKKVIRPAMVTITTGGPKRPKEETD